MRLPRHSAASGATALMLTAVLTVVSTGACGPTGTGERHAGHSDHGRHSLPGKVTLPFESPSGMICLMARVDRSHDLRLLIDTGDPGGLSLDAASASRAGLTLGAGVRERATGVAGSRIHTIYHGRIGLFALGSIEYGDLEFRTAPDAARMSRTLGIGVDGFIGLGLLRGLIMTIDYPAGTLTFEHPAPPDDGGWEPAWTAIDLENDRIVIDTMLNGSLPRRMILDTASAVTLVESSDLKEPAGGGTRVATVVDGGLTTTTLAVANLRSFEFAGVRMHDVPVLSFDFRALSADTDASIPPGVAGLIGADLLAGHIVRIDLEGGRLEIGGGSH